MPALGDIEIQKITNSWLATDRATAATATATKAAVPGKCNVVRHVYVSFSAVTSVSATLTLNFGGTPQFVFDVPTGTVNEVFLDFGDDGVLNPTANSAISAVLTSAGTGVTASVVMDGYITDPPA